MKHIEYSDICRDIVERIGGVDADTEVIIVTDPLKIEIAESLASAVRSTGATMTIAIKPRLDSHGAELPSAVAAAMYNADVLFDVNTHAITHTDARRAASEAGVDFVCLRGITEEIMIDQLDSDYDEIRAVTNAVAAIQTAAESAHVTCPEGTDITVDLTGRAGHTVTDDLESSDIVALPVGKSAITPVEGSAQGTIVVDHSIDGIGLLEDPVTLTVEDGLVQDVSGGQGAVELEARMENAGDCSRNIAEAPSLGTNPDVKLIGNQASDKKKRGTMHFAIGDNRSLGGSVECDLHFDMTLTRPTVVFDDEVTVTAEGRFQKEVVLEYAATL